MAGTNKNIHKEVEEMLLDFLKRATGKNATSEEVAIVPKVAELLFVHSDSISEK